MALFETISAFREQIRKHVMEGGIPAGFDESIDAKWAVRHPAMNQNGQFEKDTFDGKTWEIRLFQRETVCLLLQFMVRGNGEDNPQTITLHSHPFSCVKLFIYDDTDVRPEGNIVTREELRKVLNDQLQKNTAYVPADGNNNAKPWGERIGHVCDIYIHATNQEWSIPNGRNQMSDEMLVPVVCAAKDLLNIASYYYDHKQELFRKSR